MAASADISAILDAFPTDIPSRALLAAAVEGRSRGRVLSDQSRDDPVASGAVIVHNQNGTVWVGHGVSQDFLQAALSSLRHDHRLVLTMTPRQESEYEWNWAGERSSFERYEHTNLDWRLVEKLSSGLPENRTVAGIDRELFARCTWHDEMSSMLGDEDQFLANALGICQLDGPHIVTEAYAIVSDSAGAEIGAITHDSYRRAGNAAVTCALLLTGLLRDYDPIYWCCDGENVASARTAPRLGFRHRREYRFVIIPRIGGA